MFFLFLWTIYICLDSGLSWDINIWHRGGIHQSERKICGWGHKIFIDCEWKSNVVISDDTTSIYSGPYCSKDTSTFKEACLPGWVENLEIKFSKRLLVNSIILYYFISLYKMCFFFKFSARPNVYFSEFPSGKKSIFMEYSRIKRRNGLLHHNLGTWWGLFVATSGYISIWLLKQL